MRKNNKKYMTLKKSKAIMVAVCLLAFLAISIPKAHAILILPKWLIIGENQRAARVIIYNNSDDAKVVTFEWERRTVTPEGNFVKLKEGETMEGYRPADPYIKFSPRKVILQPKQNQKIRMIVQRPADLEQGEYHSHFAVHSEKLSKAQQTTEQKREGLKGVFEVNISTSIPVFLRHGQTTVDYNITNASLIHEGDKHFVAFDLVNNSTRSLYGRVELECVQNNGERVVEVLRGVRLYVESKSISHKMPIVQLDVNTCSSLKLKIFGKADREYLNKVLSEYDLQLF